MNNGQHDQPESDLPPDLSMPARRALTGAGYTRLEQLAGTREDQIMKLHGVGPKTIRQLRSALALLGLSFDEKNQARDEV